jgi:formylglycine-generating enzyme required for sulfatase activity
MNGNVSEWCWDWAGYDYSTCCDAIDYHGETNPLSNYRITRGGSFSSKDQGAYLHVFNRSNSSISSRSMFHTGLRIVMRAE